MIIPGANLLALALHTINPQLLQHRAFVSRSVNAAGDYVSVFADPVGIQGSMQPVDTALYQLLGLNLARRYAHLWTTAEVRVTNTDRQGDYVDFAGRTWQCESDRDWRDIDGWRKVLCVEVES